MTDVLIEKTEAVESKMVTVHPTVLLSIVDHYNRVASGTKKRVVGALLGYYGDKGVLEVTNCYAVPFEEDPAEPDIWFFDHIYHEQMFNMMRRINGKEKIIGWYSSGPKVRKSDIEINEIIRRYNTNPCFIICNVQEEQQIGLPTEAYFTREEVDEDGNQQRQFEHCISSIGASEAEEIGVEHLLRDVKDASQGTLSKRVSDKTMGLKILAGKLKDMRAYLEKVVEGKYRYNQTIIYQFQDIFNLLPNLKVQEMVSSFSVKSNDYMYVIYISTMIKSILSLHDLINNRIAAKDIEIEKAQSIREEEEAKKKAEAEKAAKKLEDDEKADAKKDDAEAKKD